MAGRTRCRRSTLCRWGVGRGSIFERLQRLCKNRLWHGAANAPSLLEIGTVYGCRPVYRQSSAYGDIAKKLLAGRPDRLRIATADGGSSGRTCRDAAFSGATGCAVHVCWWFARRLFAESSSVATAPPSIPTYTTGSRIRVTMSLLNSLAWLLNSRLAAISNISERKRD